MKKVGIFTNNYKANREQIIELVVNCLSNYNIKLYTPKENIEWLPEGINVIDEKTKLDCLLVFGGDGTILRGFECALETGAAILGINMGRLGFLSDFSIGEARKYLHLLFEDKYKTYERMCLDVEVFRQSKKIYSGKALNDAVVYKGLESRLIEMRFYCNGKFILETRSDGLIAASPTGSTAYSLSAGGPILSPDMEAYVVASLCPHLLSVRPMVFPASAELRFKMSKIYNQTMLQLDGVNVQPLIDNDNVYVKNSKQKIKFITLTGKNFYQTLRKKLHMGKL